MDEKLLLFSKVLNYIQMFAINALSTVCAKRKMTLNKLSPLRYQKQICILDTKLILSQYSKLLSKLQDVCSIYDNCCHFVTEKKYENLVLNDN